MMDRSSRELEVVLDAMGTDSKRASPSTLGNECWMVNVDGRRCVLKYYPPGDNFQDISWGHDFLARLSETGFPAPQPIRAFPEGSLAIIDGVLWGIVSYIPGRKLHWEPEPDLSEVGTIIAQYHEVARSIVMESNRPSALPVEKLADLELDDRIERAMGGPSGVAQFRKELDELRLDLMEIGHDNFEPIVIHGDCTTDNVIIDGLPPRISGLIDFDKSYREVDLADVGFGLYRAARPDPNVLELDPKRVSRVVASYAAARRLDLSIARAILIYARARGLQLIVRWIRRGVQDCRGALARTVWIRENQDRLMDSVSL